MTSYDQAYIGNYGLIQLLLTWPRVGGISSSARIQHAVWLDPGKMAALNLTAGDAIQALSEQNVQVAAGTIGQPPVPSGNVFQLSVNTLGRLIQPEQFADIIIKTGDNGRVTRLRDIAQVELGAREYASNSYLDGKPAMGIAIFQRPGSNALATAKAVRQKMAELSQQFPQGLEYRIVYDRSLCRNRSTVPHPG
jgi:multidrug efflux pump